MSLIRSIIDGNEVAARYVEYVRPARQAGEKMPVRHIDSLDPERAGYARDLNNYLDRLHFGYEAPATSINADVCMACHGALGDAPRLKRSIYTSHGRVDLYQCGNC